MLPRNDQPSDSSCRALGSYVDTANKYYGYGLSQDNFITIDFQDAIRSLGNPRLIPHN